MSSAPENTVPANHQSFLAFDYGLKRTGVAVGNRLMKSATPQGTIAAEGDARFAQIDDRHDEIVPASGSAQSQSQLAKVMVARSLG